MFTPALAAASEATPTTAPALPAPSGQVLLQVSGRIASTNVDDAAHFDRDMLASLPPHRIETHTTVTDGVQVFEGFRMADLLSWVGARGDTVRASALNEYGVDIPMSDFDEFDVIVAYRMNEQELTVPDKGPLWIIYPRDDHEVLQDIRYDYRWVWHLNRLHVD